jgi:O-antigen biosynthesis protein WbqP
MMKRAFDLVLGVAAGLVLLVPFILVALFVRLTSRGPVFYWSDRVGRYNALFKMPKFRSMRVGTPTVATHLLADPASHLTPIGGFLRKSSLDELPQLWSIIKGDMSFVGPRPALFNQEDLVALRTDCGVDQVPPGLTGLAQINGRDDLPIAAKVKLDAEYVQRQSLWLDLRIICLTALKVIRRDGITH